MLSEDERLVKTWTTSLKTIGWIPVYTCRLDLQIAEIALSRPLFKMSLGLSSASGLNRYRGIGTPTTSSFV